MREILKEFIEYRELFWAFTMRSIKIRYKQTVMGFMWALFMPILIVLSGVLVKQAMAILSKTPLEFSQIASLSVKALPWAFFVGALKVATTSLTGNTNLVTKIYFPREVFPVSSVLSQLFDFAIASCVLFLVLIFLRIGPSISLIWLPLLILLFVMLTAAFSLIVSCGTLFFRDVKYIVDVLLTFGIFFTPVFYEASMFGKWKGLLLLNPVGALLEAINSVVVLHRAPDLIWLIYATMWSIGGFFAALSIFHKAEFAFAENI